MIPLMTYLITYTCFFIIVMGNYTLISVHVQIDVRVTISAFIVYIFLSGFKIAFTYNSHCTREISKEIIFYQKSQFNALWYNRDKKMFQRFRSGEELGAIFYYCTFTVERFNLEHSQ